VTDPDSVPVPGYDACQARVDCVLDRLLPRPDTRPQRLHAAMRYAVLGPGKRVRPVLCYLSAAAAGLPAEAVDAAAAALEMIHAYSLVHDDLPAMDDDDLRRGRPTVHRAFDEATAILAGDALQVLAFEVLVSGPGEPAARLAAARELAIASGTRGMAGGQAIDLEAVGRDMGAAEIEQMHALKTGALLRASVTVATLLSPSLDPQRHAALERYATALGTAFQIVDDLLDIEGVESVTGKRVGADAGLNKPTYPRAVGVPAARARASALRDEALRALDPFGSEAEALRALARYIIDRSR
jgi:farnesyl diphosphate synthase